MFTRRAFLSLAAQQPQRPNILFVMVDEMRSDCMGCAGHQTVKTPTLDNLAKEGVLFRNAYTVSPVCCPSRASVFSGRYPHIHGVKRNGVPHNDGEASGHAHALQLPLMAMGVTLGVLLLLNLIAVLLKRRPTASSAPTTTSNPSAEAVSK